MRNLDFDLADMPDDELLITYRMYRDCKSRGVNDEVRLSFIQKEMDKRNLKEYEDA